jgi:hypothetical protein
MTTKIRSLRPSPALLISCVALFMALAGSAYAVGIGKNTVRSPQIVDGTVRTVDLHENAVDASKLAPNSVTNSQLAENAVTSSKVADASLTGQDVADGSLTGQDVNDGSLTSADIADHSLTGQDIAPDSIRASELGPVTVRTSPPQAIAAGANGSVSVQCGQGEQMLSGGGQPGNFGVEMTSSLPSGNGWLYQAKNNNASASTITAYVVCLLP